MKKVFFGVAPIVLALFFPDFSAAEVQIGELMVEDGAFVLSSQDKNFLMNIGGRLQFRYWYADPEDDHPFVTDEETSSFELYQARLALRGNAFGKSLNYFLQLDFQSDKNLKDAYLAYTWGDYLTIRGGFFRPPFTRQRITTGAGLLFVRRSIAVEKLAIGRDYGIMADGKLLGKHLVYQFGVWNGEGEDQKTNDDKYMLYSARLQLMPFGSIRRIEARDKEADGFNVLLGGSFMYHKPDIGDVEGDEEVEYAEDFRWSAEAVMTWWRIYLQGEYIEKSIDPDVSGMDKIDSAGWYAQAGFLAIPEKLQLAARYSWLNPNTDDCDDGSDADIVEEISVGANFFLRSYRLLLQTTYSLFMTEYPDYMGLDETGPYEVDNGIEHRFMAQLQLII